MIPTPKRHLSTGRPPIVARVIQAGRLIGHKYYYRRDDGTLYVVYRSLPVAQAPVAFR